MPAGDRAGLDARGVRRIVLTASGGPFRGRTRAELAGGHAGAGVRASELGHGPQDLGRFGHPDEQGSRSHRSAFPVRCAGRAHRGASCTRKASCIRWSNTSTARCWRSWATRTCAPRIAHALAWPERIDAGVAAARPRILAPLAFERPTSPPSAASSWPIGPCARGGNAPTVLNAANEVAVAAFLDGGLPFLAIAEVIEVWRVSSCHGHCHVLDAI